MSNISKIKSRVDYPIKFIRMCLFLIDFPESIINRINHDLIKINHKCPNSSANYSQKDSNNFVDVEVYFSFPRLGPYFLC